MTESLVGEAWQRAIPDPRRLRIDVVVGLIVTAVALLNLTLTRSTGTYAFGPPPPLAEQLLWTVLVTLPLCWRRRAPDAVAVFVAAAYIAGQVRHSPEHQLSAGSLFAVIYTLGAWGRDHRRSSWLRAGIIAAMFIWLGISYLIAIPQLSAAEFTGADGPVSPILAVAVNGVLVNVLVFGFAYYFGEIAWTAERRRCQIEDQSKQLLAAHEEEAARSVLHERLRIARELHDVVAHHVSVMGVQASAARRVFDRNPPQAKQALSAVEQSARTAVDELHRMLGLLRNSDHPRRDPPPSPPPSSPAVRTEPGSSRAAPDAHGRSAPPDLPVSTDGSPATAPSAVGLHRVPELLDSVRHAGLETSLGIFGDAVDLPESLSLAGYRIVQEAATNTLKHAGATKLDVRIRYHADELELDVADNGRGPTRRAAGGLGLIGMRERVAAHAGTLETGARTSGPGFRVRARFPIHRPAPAPPWPEHIG
ncbi:sensor histidine kinase [Dactylosporangium sp. CA-233914]|uniref:sensor histidine kinase n=1 Tax=Dactylosporangium sp. CA-233914 TaxID=3239934 RepID=UPI003D92602D